MSLITDNPSLKLRVYLSMHATSSRGLDGGGGGAHMAKLGKVELGWIKLSGVVISEVKLL